MGAKHTIIKEVKEIEKDGFLYQYAYHGNCEPVRDIVNDFNQLCYDLAEIIRPFLQRYGSNSADSTAGEAAIDCYRLAAETVAEYYTEVRESARCGAVTAGLCDAAERAGVMRSLLSNVQEGYSRHMSNKANALRHAIFSDFEEVEGDEYEDKV